MKQIHYSGSSKLISKIVHLLNRKAPLPLDGDGDPDWGSDGQVLSTDGNGNTAWVNQGGGGDVTDVEVNGTSVVNAQGVAEVSVPTKTSDLNNDSDFVSDASYVHTDENFTSTEKTKLGGIAAGAEVNVQADWNEADSTSDAYIANKPSIPAAQIQSDWTQSDNTQADYIKNKPTIPTVNDGTLTIQQNGTTVGTFSANQSGNTTVNLTGGSGSGGHTIEDTSGADLPQEENLQFVGVYTEDDSDHDRTKVNIVRQMTKAAMEALSSAEKEGFIDTTDEPDQYVPMDSEDVKYVNTTVKAKLDALTTDVSGKVSKSGDTMTGTLNIKNVAEALIINRQNSSGWSGWLGFYNQSGLLGRFGVSADKKPFFQDSTERQLATWDDLLLKYATPFFMPNAGGTRIRFTFTGLLTNESIHLLIFSRSALGDILLTCGSTGFTSVSTGMIVGSTFGTTYDSTGGHYVLVQVGAWSAVWGLFIHPYYPNATMTMTRET